MNYNSYQNIVTYLGFMAHTCNPSHLAGGDKNILSLRPAWAKLEKPYLKNKRARDIAQVAESLPSKYEALGSYPPPHTLYP
jgi:hypothetical protein